MINNTPNNSNFNQEHEENPEYSTKHYNNNNQKGKISKNKILNNKSAYSLNNNHIEEIKEMEEEYLATDRKNLHLNFRNIQRNNNDNNKSNDKNKELMFSNISNINKVDNYSFHFNSSIVPKNNADCNNKTIYNNDYSNNNNNNNNNNIDNLSHNNISNTILNNNNTISKNKIPNLNFNRFPLKTNTKVIVNNNNCFTNTNLNLNIKTNNINTINTFNTVNTVNIVNNGLFSFLKSPKTRNNHSPIYKPVLNKMSNKKFDSIILLLNEAKKHDYFLVIIEKTSNCYFKTRLSELLTLNKHSKKDDFKNIYYISKSNHTIIVFFQNNLNYLEYNKLMNNTHQEKQHSLKRYAISSISAIDNKDDVDYVLHLDLIKSSKKVVKNIDYSESEIILDFDNNNFYNTDRKCDIAISLSLFDDLTEVIYGRDNGLNGFNLYIDNNNKNIETSKENMRLASSCLMENCYYDSEIKIPYMSKFNLEGLFVKYFEFVICFGIFVLLCFY